MNKNTKQARAAGYNNKAAQLAKDESQKCVKGYCVNSAFGSPENKRKSPRQFRDEGKPNSHRK